MISLMSSVRWLVGTRHFPELKSTFPESKSNSQNPKTLPGIHKKLPRIQNTWFWEVFWVMGYVFGFWKVFFMVGPQTTPQMSIKGKFTYLLHFFSFLGQIDYDCWPNDTKFLFDANVHGFTAVFHFKVKLI